MMRFMCQVGYPVLIGWEQYLNPYIGHVIKMKKPPQDFWTDSI